MKFLLSVVLFLAIAAEVVLLQWCIHLEKRIDLADLRSPRIYLLPSSPALSPLPAPVCSLPPSSTARTPAPTHPSVKHKVEKPAPQKKEKVQTLPSFSEHAVSSPAHRTPLVEVPTPATASKPEKECTNPFGCYLPFRPFSQF